MLALSYLGLILFILWIEFARRKKTKFDFLTFFNFIFILMLPLPALILSIGLERPDLHIHTVFQLNINDSKILLSIVIGYFVILAGYYSNSTNIYSKKIEIKWLSEKKIFTIAIIFFFVSFISIQLYCLQFGGVIIALSQSTWIRMDLAEGAGPLSFLQHFMFLSYFCSYLFFSLISYKSMSKYRPLLALLFLISATNSIITTFVTGGRANLIYYFLIFYLANLIRKNRIPWLITLFLLCFAMLFTLYGKTFFFSLSFITDGFFAFQEALSENINNQPSEGSAFEEILNNFSFPLYSLNTALNTEYSLRLFVDWIYGIITFIPERILNIEVPETISTINTKFIIGSNEFEIPTGMFAFAIYSLSWPGLIIVCYLYGWLGKYFQNIMYEHLKTSNWMPFIYVIFSKIWIDFFTAGDPRVFLFTDFWALLGNGVLFLFASNITVAKSNNLKPRRVYLR